MRRFIRVGKKSALTDLELGLKDVLARRGLAYQSTPNLSSEIESENALRYIHIDRIKFDKIWPTRIIKIEMNKMKNEMIPLTIANTLDQSMKTRVEVLDTTVKQAVKHAKLAPNGNYDVYDSAGVIISNNNTQL